MEYFGKNSIAAKLKDFVERAKEFAELRKDLIKIVAIPALVIVAILFFWINSHNQGIEIEEGASADSQSEVPAEEDISAEISAGKIYVDIGGEVEMPGVYEVSEGTRLFEVIERAGGLTEEADIDVINRAETVIDGQKIMINAKGETTSAENSAAKTSTQNAEDGKVNINTATSAELQTIPGIGPSKAGLIIEYRDTNGKFKTIDDIQNVSGIGSKTFESIKEYIKV